MKILKASSGGVLWIKLCVMGISMVSVPLFAKPVFLGTYGFFSMAIPRVRETLSAWFTPAFLYVILNCIIVAIVVNSGAGIFSATATAASTHHAEGRSPPPDLGENEEKPKPIVREYYSEESMEQRSETTSMRPVETSMPPVEAASAAVAEADTLEATWNAISEAARPPPTRHLRKADTWETRRPQPPPPESVALAAVSRFGKSETWNSGRNLDRETVGAEMLRKEPSLGQDELNKRVEAFIAKVNHDMKLQREESLLHHMEMLNRGSR